MAVFLRVQRTSLYSVDFSHSEHLSVTSPLSLPSLLLPLPSPPFSPLLSSPFPLLFPPLPSLLLFTFLFFTSSLGNQPQGFADTGKLLYFLAKPPTFPCVLFNPLIHF